MDNKTKTLLGYAGIGLAAALIAGSIVWAVMNARLADAKSDLESASLEAARLDDEIEELTAEVSALKADAAPSNAAEESSSDDASADMSAEESPSDDEDGRHFCYVTEVLNETGTTMITVDYAEMLSGDEAAAAARAAGEESPPPNDYFISNVNPRLRTFPVQNGISVELTTLSEGTNPDGYTVTLGQWQDFFVGMSPGMGAIRDVPYWITIENATVVSIEEQYLP